MHIKCSSCERSINLPDDKIPKDKVFTITCPGCKAKVRVDQHLSAPPPAEAPPSPSAAPKKDEEGVDTSSFGVSEEQFEDDDDLVIYDENDKLALILDEKNKDIWTRTLEEADYKIQYAKSPEHAVHKMKFTKFHFVALHEDFGHVALKESPIYQSIIIMPMELRRHIFVALAGTDFKSLNNMEAYQASVNVVVNEKDLDKLPDILKKSINENEMFYKVFKETLHSLGKA